MRTIIFFCLASLLLIGVSGCDERDKPAVATSSAPALALSTPLPGLEAPKPDKSGKVDPLEQAKYDQQRYAEASAAADARYETLLKQHENDTIKSQVAWITGICLLAAAICGVLVFVAPIGKKTLVGLTIGFTTVAACAQAFKSVVPYLPWTGGLLIIGGAVWVAFNWKKLGNAVKVAASHGDRIEAWMDDLPAEWRDKAQKIIEDAKIETKKQAVDLGVDNPLQYLRGKTPSLWQRIVNKAV